MPVFEKFAHFVTTVSKKIEKKLNFLLQLLHLLLFALQWRLAGGIL